MSEFEDFDEFETVETDPRGGSDLVKDLRKQLKERSAAEKAAAEELASLREEVRKTRVNDVLKSKNVPEKVAKLMPQSVATAEEVEAWLTEYSDVFSLQAANQPSAVVVSDEEANAAARMSELTATGVNSTGARVSEADILGANSLDDLMKLIKGGR